MEIQKPKPYGLYQAGEAVHNTMLMIASRRDAVSDGTAIANIFGVLDIDMYLVTFWPGQVVFIIALPSNGKSFIARMFALNVLNTIMNTGDDRVVVWVTVEEPVEKVVAHFLAALSGVSSTSVMSGRMSDVELHYLESNIAEVTTWPLYIIGHSISQRGEDDERKLGARMTRRQIQLDLEYIMNFLKKDIAIVILDYVQRVHPENYEKNEPHMRETIDWTRDMALLCACPFIACSQARSEVWDKAIAIPGMGDGQWTSNISQTGDTILTSWMPKTTVGPGGVINKFGGFTDLTVEEGHMFVRVAKQREGQAGKIFLLDTKVDMLQWDLIPPRAVDLNAPYYKNRAASENEEIPF